MQIELLPQRLTYVSPRGMVFRGGSVYELEDPVAKVLLGKRDDLGMPFFCVHVPTAEVKPISEPERVIDNTANIAQGDVIDQASNAYLGGVGTNAQAVRKASYGKRAQVIDGEIDTGAAAAKDAGTEGAVSV